MGLEPGTTKDDLRSCLNNWNQGDNGILNHSRAYRLQVGAGWQINPGFYTHPVRWSPTSLKSIAMFLRCFSRWLERRFVDWSLMTKVSRRNIITISITSSACWTGTPT